MELAEEEAVTEGEALGNGRGSMSEIGKMAEYLDVINYRSLFPFHGDLDTIHLSQFEKWHHPKLLPAWVHQMHQSPSPRKL
jgi:hypothetical protein